MATPEQYIANVTRPVSKKQAELLLIVARGNPDGSYVDTHQIREGLSYAPLMQSVNFMLRYMVAQGRVEIVEKVFRKKKHLKREAYMKIYRITTLGRSFITLL